MVTRMPAHRRHTRTHPAKLRPHALAGMAGPVLFALGVLVLTAAQYEFMLDIGWRPLADPAGAWPSGLALGPHGWVMDAVFAVSGALLATFSVGLGRGMEGGPKAGPSLLFVSGAAMSLMAFETDPIRRTGPRSPHGLVHDAAFVVFAVALLAALAFLWREMRRDSFWRGHSRHTLATALIAAASLLLGGPAYYLFLAAVLAWFETTALRLRCLSVG